MARAEDDPKSGIPKSTIPNNAIPKSTIEKSGIPKSGIQKRNLPENYFRYQVYILRYTGIELVEEETFWYSIYSKLILFTIVYSYTCVEAYELYANWGDLNAVANVLNYLVTHVIGTVKITFLYVHRYRFKAMMKKLHEGLFAPNVNRGGLAEEEAIKKIVTITEIVFIIYGSMVMLVVLGGVIDSLNLRIVRPNDQWHLPFLNISMVDTTSSPTFEVAFLYQVFCIVAVGLQIISTDFIRTSIMAHLSVQLNILQSALRNLRERAVALRNSPKGQHKSLDVCLKEVMSDSINHHYKILELRNETEALCSKVVLVVMLSAVVQLCFLLYELSMVPLQDVMFIHYFSYWCVVACQAFQYCYWGNEVTLEAADVARGAAESDWVGAPNSVSKSLVPIMARAQIPLYMTAGNFVPLNLPIFMAIVKGSFSYFMVLRHMNDPQKSS